MPIGLEGLRVTLRSRPAGLPRAIRSLVPMAGALNISLTATVAPPRAGDLTAAIELVEPVLTAIAEDLNGQRLSPVRWVICDDFTAEVAAHLDPSGAASYTGGRVGGEVAAKTMADAANSGYAIYLNGPQLCDGDEVHNMASLIFLIAHELTHVLQYDTRSISPTDQIDRSTIRRAARQLGRYAIDEYRADTTGFTLLAHVASVTDQSTGDTRPAGPLDTFALGHLAGFEDALAGMYPRLAGTVEDYQNHRMTLEDLLNVVIPFTDQFVTLAAHWHAVCGGLEISDPWIMGEIATSSATELYAKPLWTPFEAYLNERLVLPGPADIGSYDADVVALSEVTVLAFWEKLGITIEDLPSGDEYVHVADPVRV
jgi:hypothetical protein